jgi:ribose transport system ATP-binding protein
MISPNSQTTPGMPIVPGMPFVELIGVSKNFGPAMALSDATLTLPAARMVSILGHNGAGKSTLIRILAGLLHPSAGQIRLAGHGVALGRFGPNQARQLGIRCVFQELSLCNALTVAENMRIVHPSLRGLGWRRRSAALIRQTLDRVFPGHDIQPDQTVGRLSLARRQMVEIARAVATVEAPPRLVILDEPTSSLDATAANQLMTFTRTLRGEGTSCVFISHRLHEVLNYTDEIVVMRDGRVVETLVMTASVSESLLVERMGNVGVSTTVAASGTSARPRSATVVEETKAQARKPGFRAMKGEVIGLAGLAGQGQRELLLRILDASRGAANGISVQGRAAYVAGDRQGEGVFPLWGVARNLSINALDRISRAGLIDLGRERALVETWRQNLAIRTAGLNSSIRSLSGGNQQKVLIARAFADEPDLVLFDDPTRGVDFGTKAELYALVQRMAAAGRTFIWYTTETAELSNCDRIYVLRGAEITDEMSREALTEERVISASFTRS